MRVHVPPFQYSPHENLPAVRRRHALLPTMPRDSLSFARSREVDADVGADEGPEDAARFCSRGFASRQSVEVRFGDYETRKSAVEWKTKSEVTLRLSAEFMVYLMVVKSLVMV